MSAPLHHIQIQDWDHKGQNASLVLIGSFKTILNSVFNPSVTVEEGDFKCVFLICCLFCVTCGLFSLADVHMFLTNTFPIPKLLGAVDVMRT